MKLIFFTTAAAQFLNFDIDETDSNLDAVYESGLLEDNDYNYEAYETNPQPDTDADTNQYLASILGQFSSEELSALGLGSYVVDPTTTTTTTTTTTKAASPKTPRQSRTLSSKELYVEKCIELEDLKDAKILENIGVTANNGPWKATIALAIERMTNPQMVADYCNEQWNKLPENQRDKVEAAVTRSSNCQEPTGCNTAWDLTGIWGYGCWCNLDAENGELTTGSGTPVNEFDAVCQKFQLCLRCAKFDNGGCDPNVDDYNNKSGPDFLNRCTEANPNDGCGLLWSNTVYDPLQLHANPNWDQSVCDVKANPNSEMDCCGEYPARFPFNTNVKTCCADGRTIYTNFETC